RSGAVVVHLIMIEFGQDFVLEVVEKIRREQPSGLSRIDETVQLVDQHRAMLLELGDHRLVQGVQLPGIHHGDQSTCDWAGILPCGLAGRLGTRTPQRDYSCSLKVVRPW